MKLRFRGNSLRLRLNQKEVSALASGTPLEERVTFPSGAALVYRLSPAATGFRAALEGSNIDISVAAETLRGWNESPDLGLYHQDGTLSIAIEKDVECVDGSPEEHDPFAYPRKASC